MSEDPLAIAYQAERDLNSSEAKQGHSNSDSTQDSGLDDSVERKFPGAKVTYGSAASGAGDNREIPIEEGGEVKRDGRVTKAKDFEGEGGPEDKEIRDREDRGGDDDVGGVKTAAGQTGV